MKKICSKSKNKIKTLEKDHHKMKISNLPDKDFKVIVIKIGTKLKIRYG